MTYAAATDRASDEDAIRALERAYDAAWTTGDAERVIAALTPDAVVVNPYGQVMNGRAQLEPALRSFLSGEAAHTTHASIVTAVHSVTADVALVDGEATIHGATLPNGGSAPPMRHSFTDVLVKRGGVWRINHVRVYTFMRQPARTHETKQTPETGT